VGVRFRDDPLERHRTVDDALHDSGNSPRNSRMIWTPISCTPCLSSISCRARAARSWTRRATSTSTGLPEVTHSATICASADALWLLSEVLIDVIVSAGWGCQHRLRKDKVALTNASYAIAIRIGG